MHVSQMFGHRDFCVLGPNHSGSCSFFCPCDILRRSCCVSPLYKYLYIIQAQDALLVVQDPHTCMGGSEHPFTAMRSCIADRLLVREASEVVSSRFGVPNRVQNVEWYSESPFGVL
jgi:hypothetical protein